MKKDVFEELVVVKRSGQRVNFNNYKIAVVIKNAFDYVFGVYDESGVNKVYEDVLAFIEKAYDGRKTINVEDIQDIIETKLKENKFLEVYQAFHDYRRKRAQSRQVFTVKAQHKFLKAMERIADDNSIKNDNDLKPTEVLLKYGRTVANEFTKSYIIDNKYLRAHEEGYIYINDMEDFPLGIISDIHLNFNNYINETKDIRGLTNKILEAQAEVRGEINIAAIDYLLEGWLVNEFKNRYQENIFNYAKLMGFEKYLNIKKINEIINRNNKITNNLSELASLAHSDQVKQIFLSAYEDALDKTTDILTDELVKLFNNLEDNLIPNKKISLSFGTNDSVAGDLINNTLLKVIESAIPFNNLILIFKIKNEVYQNYLEKVAELILNKKPILISSVENIFNKGNKEAEYFATGKRIYENVNGENQSNGRMVVAETTINMSRLGLKYQAQVRKAFYQELAEYLDIVKNELLLVFEMVGNKTSENYKILFNGNVLDDEKLERSGKIRKVIKNGNLNIGLVGLNECILALEKDENKQYNLTIEILNFINKRCRGFANETKLNFYITEPYKEDARRELIALDKAVYGEIKGITDKTHYDLISNLPALALDYGKLASIQKLLIGGNMISLDIPKNISLKKLIQMIEELITKDIGFVKINIKEGGRI